MSPLKKSTPSTTVEAPQTPRQKYYATHSELSLRIQMLNQWIKDTDEIGDYTGYTAHALRCKGLENMSDILNGQEELLRKTYKKILLEHEHQAADGSVEKLREMVNDIQRSDETAGNCK